MTQPDPLARLQEAAISYAAAYNRPWLESARLELELALELNFLRKAVLAYAASLRPTPSPEGE